MQGNSGKGASVGAGDSVIQGRPSDISTFNPSSTLGPIYMEVGLGTCVL